MKETRSDLKIVSGGPLSGSLSGDIVISDPSKLFETLIGIYEKN